QHGGAAPTSDRRYRRAGLDMERESLQLHGWNRWACGFPGNIHQWSRMDFGARVQLYMANAGCRYGGFKHGISVVELAPREDLSGGYRERILGLLARQPGTRYARE